MGQAEDLVAHLLEAECQVVLEAEVVRVLDKHASGHLTALLEVLDLKVGLREVKSDGQILREPVMGGLVEVEGVLLVVSVIHEKVGVVEHRMSNK